MSFASEPLPSLLVDRGAAATRVGDRAVVEWGQEQRVFVSSVIDGYGEYREAVVDAVREIGAEPVLFERFGGRDSSPHEAYLTEVRASTVYVGLLGARYGRPLPDRFSATHAEFLEAEREGIRTSVWVQQGVDREGPQQSFMEAVRTFQVTGLYSSPQELRRNVGDRLRVIASEDVSPWVKLGNVIFRATEISEGSGIATVRACVRDAAVASALRQLIDRTRRGRQPFSYADRVLVAEPRNVSVTTRAGRSVDVELELAITDPGQPTKINFNGVAWNRLTEIAIHVSLFGEPNPFGLMHHVVEIPNPFPALRAATVPEEALRPLARLVMSEILVTERGIERLTTFALGQPIRGHRRLRLGWQIPPPYVGQPSPLPVESEGDIVW
jgi:hypothetical protein